MAAQPQTGRGASSFWANEAEALTFNASERRAQAPCRFLVSIVLGLGAALFLREPEPRFWLWVWAGANVAAQLVELAVLWRFRKDRPAPGLAWTVAGVASIALVSLAYASGSLLMWNLPSLLGPAAAVLILGGCLVNVMMLSRGSALAFAASGLPHALFMVLGPFFARPVLAADPIRPVFALAEAVFVFGVAIVWRHLERLRQEEAGARALAEQRRAEAEAATQAKTRYAAAVSHELRTPLSAMLAAADVLAARLPDGQDAEAARMVGEAGRMMRRLLDDLLDLAKIEAGRMEVGAVPFSPRSLLEEIRRFWATEAAGSGLDLALDGAEALPPLVRGDPIRLRQVLNNLLSNAVKFTESGVVRITASVEPAGGAGGGLRLLISVNDTGCGISPLRLARLFTPFEQAHEVGVRAGGTGLGLTISRELARLMGGDVTAESSPMGSRFTVRLIVGEAATAPASAPAAEQQQPPPPAVLEARDEGPAPPQLLVIDDQPLVRQAISLLLEPLHLSPTFAATAAEGRAQMAVQAFDLILMDVNLADADGRDLARQVRAQPGPNQATPILAVTGATHEAAVATCLDSGMDGVVAKPLEPREFYAAVRAALADEPSRSRAAAA